MSNRNRGDTRGQRRRHVIRQIQELIESDWSYDFITVWGLDGERSVRKVVKEYGFPVSVERVLFSDGKVRLVVMKGGE